MNRIPGGLAIAAVALLAASEAHAQQKASAQLRGFSVILLEGDQQQGSGSDLPPAARAAIDDVKDFLPFRSYRVLDSSWTLASNQSRQYSSQLRGGDQNYEALINSTLDGGAANVDVKFTLREVGPHGAVFSWAPGSVTPNARGLTFPDAHRVAVAPGGDVPAVTNATRESLSKEEANQANLRRELDALLKRLSESHPDVEAMRSRVAESQLRVDRLRQQVEANGRRTATVTTQTVRPAAVNTRTLTTFGRAVIDTSFSMRLGETVVVGTSRVGGDKALIALLTAVSR